MLTQPPPPPNHPKLSTLRMLRPTQIRDLKMKKNLLFLIFFASYLLTFAQTSTWDGSASSWTKGSGTENDPYLIESAANLAYLSQQVIIMTPLTAYAGKYFKLTTNINLNNIEWIPIGGRNMQGDYSSGNCFYGNFDGNNKTISNIKINAPTKSYTGLFGCVDHYYWTENVSGGIIQNLKIISGTIVGKNNVGGIVGCGEIIMNCENSASIQAQSGGGIAGNANSIINCTNFGQITGADVVGIGRAFNILMCVNKGDINGNEKCAGIGSGTIESCYNSGNINCTPLGSTSMGSAGGISDSGSEIKNCYNTGNITSTTSYATVSMGGIIGFSGSSVTNCYNTGILTCTSTSTSYGFSVGGIAGFSYGSVVSNCYNIGNIICISDNFYFSGAIIGNDFNTPTITNCHYLNTCIPTNNGYGTSQTSATMKSQGFVNTLNSTQNPKPWYLNTSFNNGYPSLVFLPYIETHEATSITSNSATLNGILFAGSENITAKGFRYKKYGTSSYTIIPITGSNLVTTISCEPFSGYLFQAYAATASGTVYGEELSFTTLEVGIDEIAFTKPIITSSFNQIKIRFEDTFSFSTEVFDIIGKTIYQGNFIGNATINIQQCGIYFIRIQCNGKVFTQKMVIH